MIKKVGIIMTERQLKGILHLLKTAKIDSNCLTTKEVADLQQTVKSKLNALCIKKFKQFIDDALPSADGSEEDWEKFYSYDWSVSFAGKTITIHNDAAVYNRIRDALDECIK